MCSSGITPLFYECLWMHNLINLQRCFYPDSFCYGGQKEWGKLYLFNEQGEHIYISHFLKDFISMNFYLSPVTKQDILSSLRTRGQPASVHSTLLFLFGSGAFLFGGS
uniref:Uncharacterized protein n=2 Tax=Micrurus TaxID=8634 RepID=A0A2D4GKB1_MICCO